MPALAHLILGSGGGPRHQSPPTAGPRHALRPKERGLPGAPVGSTAAGVLLGQTSKEQRAHTLGSFVLCVMGAVPAEWAVAALQYPFAARCMDHLPEVTGCLAHAGSHGLPTSPTRHYDIRRNDDVINFFNDFSDHLAEEALWELSLKIKPRNITRRKTDREEKT